MAPYFPRGHQQRLGRARDDAALVVHLGGGRCRRCRTQRGLGAQADPLADRGRTRCTVRSVFMKFHSARSSAAEAPEAESTQVSSRCSGHIASPGTSGSPAASTRRPARGGSRRPRSTATRSSEVAARPRRRRLLVVAVGGPVLQGYAEVAGPRPPNREGPRLCPREHPARPVGELGLAQGDGAPGPQHRGGDEVVEGQGPSRSMVNRPIVRGASSSTRALGRAGPQAVRRAARARSRGRQWPRSSGTAPVEGLVEGACGRVHLTIIAARSSRRAPISGIPSSLCILLAGPENDWPRPFSSVGRASPW